jgi:metal-responsive CopG/Arc/MetJ family transcriptional regulator
VAQDKPLLSDELLREVHEAADAEQRGVNEVLADAVRLYLDDRKWRNLVESGSRRAQALGLTEDDVPRLVAEARRDRHHG